MVPSVSRTTSVSANPRSVISRRTTEGNRQAVAAQRDARLTLMAVAIMSSLVVVGTRHRAPHDAPKQALAPPADICSSPIGDGDSHGLAQRYPPHLRGAGRDYAHSLVAY